MRKTITTFMFLFLFVCTTVMAQTMGTMTDPRDKQSYKTVVIGDFIIMVENLNYTTPGAIAYDDKKKNRRKFGLLYTWESANKACPDEWHLPSNSEWGQIVTHLGEERRAYRALKATSGWNDGRNGSNSSGFNAVPGGSRSSRGSFGYMGERGGWWSSTANKEHTAHTLILMHDYNAVPRFDMNKGIAYSCRCIKN